MVADGPGHVIPTAELPGLVPQMSHRICFVTNISPRNVSPRHQARSHPRGRISRAAGEASLRESERPAHPRSPRLKSPHPAVGTAEWRRLHEVPRGRAPWRHWGPYLSERAWGTVREDYSADGDAWGFFPHDHARSRAYRWNEDGLAGVCDDRQTLCLALASGTGADPILKERIFGLDGHQGNHGEDVKEYWWYLDATPTHSWMRWRYTTRRPRSPTTGWSRRTRAAGRLRSRVRAARHRRLRRRPVLRGHRRLRQGRPGRTS